jgi:hypothetical protein
VSPLDRCLIQIPSLAFLVANVLQQTSVRESRLQPNANATSPLPWQISDPLHQLPQQQQKVAMAGQWHPLRPNARRAAVVLVVAVAVRVEARKPQQHPVAVAVAVATVAVVAVVAAAAVAVAVAAVEVCLSYHVSLKIARRGGGGIPWSVSV